MYFEEDDALQLAHAKICKICVMFFHLKKKKKEQAGVSGN